MVAEENEIIFYVKLLLLRDSRYFNTIEVLPTPDCPIIRGDYPFSKSRFINEENFNDYVV